ncbi:MAG: HlyC/CorC family transporter [Candidatus Coatesbacteria bacterium]|nr:MAG: HlyC/CorC family transporter [Candidatus Coatesbacteria bacterium]
MRMVNFEEIKSVAPAVAVMALGMLLLRYLAYTIGENIPYSVVDAVLVAPFYVLTILLFPISWLILKFEKLIELPFIRFRKLENITTSEDLEEFIEAREGEEELLERAEVDMLKGISEIKETIAKEIMVPRIDMVVAEVSTPVDELKRMIVEAGHSRIPIYEGKVDNTIGILHAKDLLLADDKSKIREIIREPYFIPETKKINQLLQEFQSKKLQMAIVVDEYGGVAGLVTIEDILEEIVGEIQDEYDYEEKEVVRLPDGSYRVSAKIDIEELNELLDIRLPEEGFETLGGYILQMLERVPDVGEVIEADGLSITIKEADEKRIHWVEIRKDE